MIRTVAPVAELRDITVTYGVRSVAVNALRGVSLEVYPGEVLLLMGPSGSGKSTLLQVLGCIRYATGGEILINGRAIRGLSEEELSRLRCEHIGFVFQHYNLLPSLRAWENVALALELRGRVGPEVEAASRAALIRLGLSHRLMAFPSEMSGGEKQRVAIARAVVGEPGIILADEPTAALDAASGAEVAKLLAGVAREQNRAVVIVTHDARVSGIADRIVYLEDGTIRSIRQSMQSQTRSLRESGGVHEAAHELENNDRSPVSAGGQRHLAVSG